MMTDSVLPDAELQDAAPDHRSHPALRALTGFSGAAIFLCSILLTLGVGPAALVGLLIVVAIQRRRGRSMGLLTSWATAAGVATVLVAVGIGVIFLSLPAEDWDEIWAAAESEPTTQPEWLLGVSPAVDDAAAAAEPSLSTRAFVGYFGILAASVAAFIIGAVLGSVGWVTAILLGHSIMGRWPFRQPSRESVA